MSNAGQPRSRTVRRSVLAAALALLALVGSVLLAGPASAHASLVGTDPVEGTVLPTRPDQVTFTFDEPVRSQPGGIHLFDATGDELDAKGRTRDALLVVDLPDAMGEGTFIVTWRVVSTDGHPIGGALTFSIGAPSETVATKFAAPASSPRSVEAALGIAQALAYLGIFGAGGLVAFALLLLPREKGVDQVRAQLLRVARGFGWLVVVGGGATLVLTTLYQRGQGFAALFGDEPFEIPTGAELLAWVLSVVGTGVAVIAAGRAPASRQARRAADVVALAGVLLALVSLGLVGHTRAFPPLWLMLAADLSHVLAGTAWFGGLIGLVISLRRLVERPRLAAEVLGRFSTLAAWFLVAVAVTGSLLGWRILRSWNAVVDTDFGRLLLVKVAVVGLVAAVAAWNRFRLMPAVLADSGFAERGAASGRMRRAVRVEAVLLVGVLGLTGFLVDRSPVEDQAAITLPGGFDSSTFTGQLDDVRVVAVVQPATIGPNEVLFQIQDLSGNPLEPFALPELSVVEGEVALGDQAVTDVDSGTYRASVLIPRAGTWSFQVSVPLSEFDNPVVSVKVPVAAAATP